MKKISLLLAVATSIIFTSCKKEVSPELALTVYDVSGAPSKSKKVKIFVTGDQYRAFNAKAIDSAKTDAFGKAFFKFDNTILVDIYLYGAGGKIVDSTSVLCETKRLKNKEKNIIERSLTFN